MGLYILIVLVIVAGFLAIKLFFTKKKQENSETVVLEEIPVSAPPVSAPHVSAPPVSDVPRPRTSGYSSSFNGNSSGLGILGTIEKKELPKDIQDPSVKPEIKEKSKRGRKPSSIKDSYKKGTSKKGTKSKKNKGDKGDQLILS
jgi:hypothetical protein